jgi:hypothetical protein
VTSNKKSIDNQPDRPQIPGAFAVIWEFPIFDSSERNERVTEGYLLRRPSGKARTARIAGEASNLL